MNSILIKKIIGSSLRLLQLCIAVVLLCLSIFIANWYDENYNIYVGQYVYAFVVGLITGHHLLMIFGMSHYGKISMLKVLISDFGMLLNNIICFAKVVNSIKQNCSDITYQYLGSCKMEKTVFALALTNTILFTITFAILIIGVIFTNSPGPEGTFVGSLTFIIDEQAKKEVDLEQANTNFQAFQTEMTSYPQSELSQETNFSKLHG
ncbi:uncharacterized protein KGF55_002078 [Candida pseudojiufengensis]|uniref:uncharacterized protein n=1 Tax=Candida pseudojiufengensis TaxID=497109 RepID=UPI002224EF71|nr:uncharacterized protein KGF55_002078 [Candida pseudojiufengensis]KAI5964136.1 hypothetical protein KGF55_002078 [Candida pseudojiufengensis]